MTKTIKNKTIKNKTIKNKTIKNKELIKAILKEWKNIKGGYYEKDKITIYENDYYLSLKKTKDFFYNHIHLILKNMNDIKYIMKKMDTDGKITHSQVIKINTLSNSKKIVHKMILDYKNFVKM